MPKLGSDVLSKVQELVNKLKIPTPFKYGMPSHKWVPVVHEVVCKFTCEDGDLFIS